MELFCPHNFFAVSVNYPAICRKNFGDYNDYSPKMFIFAKNYYTKQLFRK